MRFPKLNVRPQSREFIQEFGGLDRRPRISENYFSEMKNLTGDFYPALAPRRKRGIVGTMEHCNALLTAGEKMACVRGNTLYWGDEAVLELNAGEGAQRQLVMMGAYIVVFPDNMYFNTANAEDKGGFGKLLQSKDGEFTFSLYHQKDTSTLVQDATYKLLHEGDGRCVLAGTKYLFYDKKAHEIYVYNSSHKFGGTRNESIDLEGIPNLRYKAFGDFEVELKNVEPANSGGHINLYNYLSEYPCFYVNDTESAQIVVTNKRTGISITHYFTTALAGSSLNANEGYWLHCDLDKGTATLCLDGQKVDSVVCVESSQVDALAYPDKTELNATITIAKGDNWQIPYLAGVPTGAAKVCFSGGAMWMSGALVGTTTFTTSSANELDADDYIASADIGVVVPAMDFVIESQNRLWGCYYGPNKEGKWVNEIYASALGDFKDWYTRSGISTDSYAVSVGMSGPFTGAINYRGFPLFFKENAMYKVYGDYPANYQIVSDAGMGVQQGCDKSLFVLSNVLYYKSPDGIFAYNGSSSERIDAVLGSEYYKDVACCGTGTKLWLSMVSETDAHSGIYVCDTEKGLWHKEDGTVAHLMVRFENDVYILDTTGRLFTANGSAGELEEGEVPFFAQSGVIGYSTPDSKYVSRLALRVAVPYNGTLRIYIEYDSTNVWEFKGSIEGNGMSTFPVPVVPRLCDHFRIRLEGKGDCRIFGFSKVLEEGGSV